jgi:hypothetical protein
MWYPLNSLVEKFLDSKWFKFVLYFEFEFKKRCTIKRDANHVSLREIEC